jgi:hypothetical protein
MLGGISQKDKKQTRLEHPGRGILFTTSLPVQERGWNNHPILPNQPKKSDHFFSPGKTFKPGVI